MLKQLFIGDKPLFFWPRSDENRAALRTAIGVVAALLLSFSLHLHTPYWSAMTVVFIANLYTGSILDKAIMRVTGTVIGAILGLYLAGIIQDDVVLYFVSCFFIVAISAYYFHKSTYGYGFLLGGLGAFIVISQLAISYQNPFLTAVWRPVEIGLGVLISALSVYLVFPNHLKDNILEQVPAIFNDFSVEFSHLLEYLSQGSIDPEVILSENLAIKRKLRKAIELIGAMNLELGVTKAQTDELRAVLDVFYALTHQVHYFLISLPSKSDKLPLITFSIEPVFRAVKEDLASLALIFINPLLSSFEGKTGQCIEDLVKQLQVDKTTHWDQSDLSYALIHFLQQVNQNLALIATELTQGSVIEQHQLQRLTNTRELSINSEGELLKLSVKTGISVTLALGFWMLSNAPAGLNGIISSLVISVRKNLYEMKQVSMERLLGCFVGGSVALLFLGFVEINLFTLTLILFFFVWFFSYFTFKWPKYAQIGMQASVALIISLAQEGGPPVGLDAPLQRLGGIVIGILASSIVANLIWRSDVWTILDRYIIMLQHYLSLNVQQAFSSTQKPKALYDMAELFWTTRGILDSLNDEPLSLANQQRLTQCRLRFESLVILQATISNLVHALDRERALASAKRLAIDLSGYEYAILAHFKQQKVNGVEPLTVQLNQLLSEMKYHPVSVSLEDQDRRNLIAYINVLYQLVMNIPKTNATP